MSSSLGNDWLKIFLSNEGIVKNQVYSQKVLEEKMMLKLLNTFFILNSLLDYLHLRQKVDFLGFKIQVPFVNI